MPSKAPGTRISRPQAACALLGIIGLTGYAVSKFTPGRVVVVVAGVGLLGFIFTAAVVTLRARRPVAIVRAVIGTLLAVVLGTYLILFPLVGFGQDAIADRTPAFFQPHSISEAEAQALTASDVEAIDLATPDGARLRGWLVRNSDAARAPLLIYFDGSGSETSWMIPYARKLSGWSVALVKYRGFGPSTGTPGHANTLADAALIYDTLAQRPDVDTSRIVAMGYSLGTGIAVYLSAERPIAATVLAAPYDYLTLIGLKQPVLYAPLAGIMHRYFDSISRAPGIHNPLLCLIGANDGAVPPDRSLNLARSWGGETVIKTYEGEDHGLLFHANSSWDDIAAFLQSVARE